MPVQKPSSRRKPQSGIEESPNHGGPRTDTRRLSFHAPLRVELHGEYAAKLGHVPGPVRAQRGAPEQRAWPFRGDAFSSIEGLV